MIYLITIKLKKMNIMKKTAPTFIIALLVVLLTACAKKSNVQANSLSFYNNPFTAKSILATAD
jgi:hypothetical protein